MLVRFRQDVIALKPKVVVIQGGTNDIAGVTGPGTRGTLSDNIMSMTELAKANGIRVVLASITPVCDCTTEQTDLRPQAQNRSTGTSGSGVRGREPDRCISTTTRRSPAAGTFKKDLTVDGLLPNDAGYAVMATARGAGDRARRSNEIASARRTPSDRTGLTERVQTRLS